MVAATLPAQQRPDAWLLDFGQGLHAAVGTRVLVQIIDEPKLHRIPCTPSYCDSVVSWQGRLLPVMDLAARLGATAQAPRLLAVAAYQDQPQQAARFGALLLHELPVAIVVGTAQSCPLPQQPAAWNRFALSCFDHQGAAVPVLHLGRIFLQADQVPAPAHGG